MELTFRHFQIIKEAIVKLECYSCQIAIECHIRNKTYCSDISKWLRKQEEENN